MQIRLLSIDFDGTLISRVSEPVLDRDCMELIRELQTAASFGRSTPAVRSISSSPG